MNANGDESDDGLMLGAGMPLGSAGIGDID